MVVIGIAVVVMAVALVVLACFMIPAFIEVRKTAAATREFIGLLQNDIKPVLRNLQETLADLKVITEEASDKVEEVGIFMEELGNTGRSIRTINTVIGGVSGLAARSSLWLTGAKVAGKFIAGSIFKKRG